jgi:hypothetical protein
MTKAEKSSPHVMISARDLKDIIRDELYGVAAKRAIHPDDVKEIAKRIVNRALLSPK